MGQIKTTVSRTIHGPAEDIYAILADYHHAHQTILPTPYFTRMTVEEGGAGAGTVVRVEMNVMGVRSVLRLRVREPEPGRVLVEEDPEAGVVTTFTIDPVAGGRHARVTIETVSRASPGLRGRLEQLFNPPIIRRIYEKEFDLLASHFDGQSG